MQVQDQPPPIATDRRPAWDLVIEYVERKRPLALTNVKGVVERVIVDMRERDALGRQRYGVPLTARNGRDHLVDAYQEALDFAAYLAAELDEHGVAIDEAIDVGVTHFWHLLRVQSMLWDHVQKIVQLRTLIEERAS